MALLGSFKDGRAIVYPTKQYDANGRLTQQTLADPSSVYHFAYTLDCSGKVTQTDIMDPRGHVEQLAFNSAHYVVSDTQAVGLPEARTVTTERQAGSNEECCRHQPAATTATSRSSS